MSHRSVDVAGPARRSARVGREGGFTLIEIISVVFLVGIVMAMAVMKLEYAIPKYRLRAAAREVGSLLKQAKTRAASSVRDVYVVCDMSKSEYWLLVAFPRLKEDGSVPGPDEPAVYEYEEAFHSELPENVQFVDVILGADQKIGTGQATARVSAFGASNHVIINMRLDDMPIATKMNGLTGVITFHEDYENADELIEDKDE